MGMTALARGLRVVQVHAAKAMGPAEDPAGELRRKIRIGRGSMQFFARNPLLYVPWSGLRGWVVFSHKGLRLLLPWLMLALLVGSAVGSIDSPHHRVLLIAQLKRLVQQPSADVVPTAGHTRSACSPVSCSDGCWTRTWYHSVGIQTEPRNRGTDAKESGVGF